MYYPTLEQIKEIIKTGDYNLVPVCKEMYGDSITPIEVMRILKKHSKHCYMLESVDDTNAGAVIPLWDMILKVKLHV